MTRKEQLLKEVLLYEETLKDPLFKGSRHIIEKWLKDAKHELFKITHKVNKRKVNR